MAKQSDQLTTTLTSTEKDIIRSISLSGEHWKQVRGHSSNYFVSNMGRLLTTRQYGANIVAVMKPAKDKDGHYRTVMDGKTVKVHRIVAENWLENPNSLPCVNHINSDPSDNRAENLEWCTWKYNAWWGYSTGKIEAPKGPTHNRAKKEDRQFVREAYLALTKNMGHTKAENLERAKFYDKLQKKYPNISRETLKDWACRGLRSWKQSPTTLLASSKHHTHILSETDIVL